MVTGQRGCWQVISGSAVSRVTVISDAEAVVAGGGARAGSGKQEGSARPLIGFAKKNTVSSVIEEG